MLDYLLGVAVLICVYAINAVSLNLQVGYAGMTNFGQVAFVGVGAYAVAIVTRHGIAWPVGFAVGAGLAAAAGAAVGRLGRTLSTDYWAIATLALAELVRLLALNQESLTGGAQGISNVRGVWTSLSGRPQSIAVLTTIAVVLAVVVVLARLVVRGQYGRLLRTIRENQDLAAALGHDVISLKMRTMAFAAAIASLSGGFYAMYISYIGPSQLLPTETFLVFTMIVVGGLASVYGSVVGAMVITLVYDGSRYLPDVVDINADQAAAIRIMLIGAGLLFFLLARNRGVVPEKPRTFNARGR